MRVLVVDDDPLAGEMTVAVLEDLGHNCQFAENGVDAMSMLAGEDGFDLIISDMNMPLVSGIDLFREIRSQGVDLPFILLSGDDPDGPRAAEPKLDACLLKDFSLEESLPRVIDEVLSRR
ncbi:MAG: response regulator [Sulfurimicrobium sp.]|nr:response regulator [Sulfurimicrobium sp.]